MKRRLKRLLAGALIFAAGTAIAGFFGIPVLLGSDWTRREIERRAGESLGTAVHVGDVRFTWGDGLIARDVRTDRARLGEMAARWQAREVRLKPKWTTLLSRRPEVRATIRNPRLRLWYAEPTDENAAAAGTPKSPRFIRARAIRISALTIENGKVDVDHPSFTRAIKVDGIRAGMAIRTGKGRLRVSLHHVRARLNGGEITGRGKLRIGARGAHGEIALHAKEVEVDEFARGLIRHFQPMLEVLPGTETKPAVEITARAKSRAPSVAHLLRHWAGAGTLRVYRAAIEGSKLIRAVGQELGLPNLVSTQFTEVIQAFELRPNAVRITESTARSSGGSVRLQGTVGLDRRLDLRVGVDPELGGSGRDVRVGGTIEHPKVRP